MTKNDSYEDLYGSKKIEERKWILNWPKVKKIFC
jgi:hypothetical protein